MEELNESFWNNRYRHDETGWDMGRLSPPLKEYIDQIENKKTAILIPGCGNAYEAAYLLDNGFHNVTLLDISSFLIGRLKKRFSGQPITLVHDDFFLHDGKYDLILEQTFFCAIPIHMRKDYVRKAHDLLHPDGRIAGVLFNENFGFEDHPPFKGSEEEYRRLFEPWFTIHLMETCTNSIAPRLGNELFFEMGKKAVPHK